MLELYRLLVTFEFRKISRFFSKRTLAKSIVTFALLCIFGFVSISLFFFFLSSFYFLGRESVDGIHAAISLFVYEVFLLSISILASLSSAISIIFNLFKRNDENWVLTSPFYVITGHLALFRAVISSLFVCAIVFVPAITAFAHVYHSTWYEALWLLFSIMSTVVLVSGCVYSLCILVGVIYQHITRYVQFLPYSFGGLVVGIGGIFLFGLHTAWRSVKSIDLVAMFKAESTETILNPSVVGDHFIALPTHLAASVMLALQEHGGISAYLYGGLLAILTGTTLLIAYLLSPFVMTMWVKFQEHRSLSSHLTISFRFNGSTLSVLAKKEALFFIRNIRGLLWFFFLVAIWCIQIATSSILEKNLTRQAVSVLDKEMLIRAIEFAIATYFVSSFALRFVFPSFSLERRTAWILSTAPYKKLTLFVSKLIFFVLFFTGIVLLMNVINSIVLGISFIESVAMYCVLTAMVLFIVTASLSFGMMFPSYDTEDPEVMSTSMPGLTLTGVLLSFGFCTAYALYHYNAITSYSFVMGICVMYCALSGGMFLFVQKTKKLT